MDELKYNQIPIDRLNLSNRSYNLLKRAKINTLKEVLDAYESGKLHNIKNLGKKSYEEICETIINMENKDFCCEEKIDLGEVLETYIVPEELEEIPIDELKLSVRLHNGLIREGYNTVGKILRMTNDDLFSIHGMGAKSIDELQNLIGKIKESGIDHFADSAAENDLIDDKHKRTIDIQTVNKLRKDYGFKSVWLTEWYNVTRSRIQQILGKSRNRGDWLNRELTESNITLLLEMINSKLEISESSDGTKAYFLNNLKDDCAVLFVNEEEIKCFFMSMLPEDIQQIIRDRRLDSLSTEELKISSTGKTIAILKKEYFCPSDTVKFRQFANLRGMSIDEYCEFLTGKKYVAAQSTINDQKILDFLNAHYTNGQLLIPSNNSTHWFRTFISKKGYSIDEIAKLYGFMNESCLEEMNSPIPETLEEDMQQHKVLSENWLDKLYAENPLIGNMLLPEKTKEKLYSITKNYIDKRLNDSRVEFSLKVKMQITLSVVTFAKEWDTGDESGFWRFITAQFGYRDETNQLRKILCDCIWDAMQKNKRWFVSSSSGYQYKSTIVVHALTTKSSWMSFYDFLFDFYKTNMEWTFIEDDPIINRMVTALRSKLVADDGLDDESIQISTKVYSFQEGIRKLVIYRTRYAVNLITHMLGRIDGVINYTERPARMYVDILCDQWMEGKIKNVREAKNHSSPISITRNVAITYSRIRPVYVLTDEMNVVISFPDIRLKKTEFDKVELRVYVNEIIIETKVLSFYGNELGKTLNGFNVDVNMCLRRGDGSLRINIALYCGEEQIFDSRDTLYRESLCFLNGKEYSINECKRGSYFFVTTNEKALKFSGAEVSYIDSKNSWNVYFVKLGKGFLVKQNEQILAFDDLGSTSSDGIRVINPVVETGISFEKKGKKFSVISKDMSICIIAHDQEDLQKYVLTMNSQRLQLGNLSPEILGNDYIYAIPLQINADRICEFQVVDLQKNCVISKGAIKLLQGFSVKFNRDFYFTEKDYENAYVNITTLHRIIRHEFNSCDENLSIPIDDGIVEVKIPRIFIRNNAGEKWESKLVNWIKNVKQDEKIYLTFPDACVCNMKVNDVDIVEESEGCFGYGNAVYAYSDQDKLDWLEIKLHVSSNTSKQDYIIGHLSKEERFLEDVQFDYRNNTLYWNKGMGFLGNKEAQIYLHIDIPENVQVYSLDLDNEVVFCNHKLPLGEYDYRIVKKSQNIFREEETILWRGILSIGDKNELRFCGRMIEITNITYEEGGNIQNVVIKNTYIDQIEYQGIQFVDSEDRWCPVYCGVMFYLGQSMEHHDFSFEERENEKGILLYKINPVKIIYINEHTLSITNEEGDGIYYYRYYNKNAVSNHYAITDREPIDKNQDVYYLADLYTYEIVERTL